MDNSIIRKILSGVMALIVSLNIMGCSSKTSEQKFGTDMESVLTQLFNAVQINDREKAKTFFADDIVELYDFDEGMNYIFSQYSGDLLDVNWDFTIGTGKCFVPGENICYAFATYDIISSENEYMVYVEFYTEYKSKYPDGSYRIRKLKLLDKQSLNNGENFNDCTLRYGIYYPGWTDGIEY